MNCGEPLVARADGASAVLFQVIEEAAQNVTRQVEDLAQRKRWAAQKRAATQALTSKIGSLAAADNVCFFGAFAERMRKQQDALRVEADRPAIAARACCRRSMSDRLWSWLDGSQVTSR
jgi:hypothetical protein